jgi:hypothetical protein
MRRYARVSTAQQSETSAVVHIRVKLSAGRGHRTINDYPALENFFNRLDSDALRVCGAVRCSAELASVACDCRQAFCFHKQPLAQAG